MQALNALAAVAAVAYPGKPRSDRKTDTRPFIPAMFRQLPPDPQAQVNPLPIGRLVSHLDKRRFRA